MQQKDRAAAGKQAAFFNQMAATWEQRHYPLETRVRLADLVKLWGVAKNSQVLDLGCGTGVLAPYLRGLTGSRGTIVSVDVSFEMLRLAALKDCYASGGPVLATALELPIQNARLDTVVCFAAFPHFSDKRAAMSEMRRVLKTSGNLNIAHLLSRAELARHHGGHRAVADDTIPNEADMRGMLAAAGFSGIEITDIPGRYLATAKAV